MTSLHPARDAIAEEVRSWYTDWRGRSPGPPGSDPGVEIRVEHAPYGHLRAAGAGAGRLLLTVDDPALAEAAIQDAASFFGTSHFDTWIDDRRRAATLEAALVAHGWRADDDNTVVLALVGPLQGVGGPPDLVVEEVREGQSLIEWARVKLLAFADAEEHVSPAAVERELVARKAELPIARYDLARLDGEPVAVIAHYMASDQMVFNLATRVPFRRRGVGQALLRNWAERALSAEARSLLINCDERGKAANLYRRMGFTDEVYWHRRYQQRGA